MKQCPARALAEDPEYQSTAALFRVLSNRHSLRIALELRHGEMGISRMARKMRMKPERLFREVLRMVQHRLVNARRQSKRILYGLEHAEIVQVLDLMGAVSERRLKRNASDENLLEPRSNLAALRPGKILTKD